MNAWVEVSETRVFLSRRGHEWWIWYRFGQPESRFMTVAATLAGEIVRVACDNREEAQWLADHMVSFGGLPKAAVKVRGPRVPREDGAGGDPP